MVIWLVLSACESTGPEPLVQVAAPPDSPRDHAATCAEWLGPVPGFDCEVDGLAIPVTVDGVSVEYEVEACDRPNFLERSCVPGSRVGRIAGDRPSVNFVFVCRSLSEDDGVRYDDVALIGHDTESGATCFFQSFPEDDQTTFVSPHDDPDAEVWTGPEAVADAACASCHLPDPFLHSPWIDQVRDPTDPTQFIVPSNPPFGRYWIAGGPAFDGWRLEHFDLPDNACAACHRIGRTARMLDAVEGDAPLSAWGQAWPQVRWMPPAFDGAPEEWETLYEADVRQIRRCLQFPVDEPAECRLSPIPGR